MLFRLVLFDVLNIVAYDDEDSDDEELLDGAGVDDVELLYVVELKLLPGPIEELSRASELSIVI